MSEGNNWIKAEEFGLKEIKMHPELICTSKMRGCYERVTGLYHSAPAES